MSKYNRMMFFFIFLFALMLFISNLMLNFILEPEGKHYMTEINRVCADIAQNGENTDTGSFHYIRDIDFLPSGANEKQITEFYENNSVYIIKYIDGVFTGLVKFTVITDINANYNNLYLLINIIIIASAATIISILLYLKKRILKPFSEVSDMPVNLAKGRLNRSIKESKSRFFGKFVWGLDMLRETLEEHKTKELNLAKENKMIILSISHDIKTPLAAIKLYARALPDCENVAHTAERINENANKIEAFVSEIIKTSKEDFINIEFNNNEFYLAKLIDRISGYYREKLGLLKTEFVLNPFQNCILYGDIERSVEAFENILENAIKYGDGKKIEVNISREEDCCLITVANSGNSLPENETVHIFDSFWRGSNAKDKQGSGLGLYICRKIFTGMKGDIFADTADGKMCVTAVMKII